MAEVQRKRTLVNPGRKRKRRNGPRKMSAKQIAIFGSKRQKAALKASRKRKRNAAKPRHSSARRNASRKAARPARRTARAARRRRSGRRNPGGIIEVALNPSTPKRRKMAKTRKRRKSTSRRRTNRRRRTNPAPVQHHRRRRRSTGRRTHRRRRSNPSVSRGGLQGFLLGGLAAAGGFVATKAATQFALGASNTGVMGYLGNLVAAFIVGKGVGMFTRNKAIENGVMIGGALVVVARLVSDNTPLGSTLSQYGLGDYEASTWLSPARYVNAATSAQVDIPTALRPVAVPSPNGKGMSGMGLSGTYGRGRSTY